MGENGREFEMGDAAKEGDSNWTLDADKDVGEEEEEEDNADDDKARRCLHAEKKLRPDNPNIVPVVYSHQRGRSG